MSMISKIFLVLISVAALTVTPAIVNAEQEDDLDEQELADDIGVRIYRNPEERREAGLGTEVYPGIVISGLVEVEKTKVNENFSGVSGISTTEPTSLSLQLAAEVEINEFLKAELIYEYEKDGDEELARWDEAFLEFELGKTGVSIGRFNVPFGEYYSHMPSGPLLEFGETRGDALVIDYSPTENFEIAIFGFDSQFQTETGSASDWDWGAQLEYTNESESIVIGASYLSDLAEAEEQLLELDEGRYENRVDALSAYALFGFESFEVTLEWLTALDNFSDLDPEFDKPSAWNFETAWFLGDRWQFALRYEQSDELEEEPEIQYGAGITWRPSTLFTISVDYLRGEFAPNFAFNDDDIELKSRNQVAIQLAIEL